MAKAQITTARGINVKIEGSPAEITAIVKELEAKATKDAPASTRGKTKAKQGRVLLVDLVGSLIDGGFFKKPRDLASVKASLAEMGHHYPMTTLSGAMLRQVRKRNIRRIREHKRWLYVH